MASEHSYQPTSQAEDLKELVRHRRAATTIELAGLIAVFPDVDQRYQEARREIYMLMVDYALGRLTDAERDRVLDILRPACPELFATPPEKSLPEKPIL